MIKQKSKGVSQFTEIKEVNVRFKVKYTNRLRVKDKTGFR